MKIVLAQINATVGDFEYNFQKHIEYIDKYEGSADLIVFPELSLCGYPPEDMAGNQEFLDLCDKYSSKLIKETAARNIDVIYGSPWQEDNNSIFNSIILASKGKIIYKQYKYDLPNYGVFDEKRVFKSGEKPKIFDYKGNRIGILICEDIWNHKNSSNLRGADFILSINASPFETEKRRMRLEAVRKIVKKAYSPVLYLNQICGHDDLVFDGGSFVLNEKGEECQQLKYFEEDFEIIDTENLKILPENKKFNDDNYHIYKACMLGLKDYVEKNGFKGVVIGLSGGVDSAITATMAVDTLGSDRVKLVFMPSKFTSNESRVDAEVLAKNLNIELKEISIEPLVAEYLDTLEPFFEGMNKGITEENIQARIRGTLLMAFSNKFGDLLLSTGNKSEVAVGYGTLYGDMSGGYNLIKDLYKTKVFELCNWRNENYCKSFLGGKGSVIPKNIITKAPTAELRENQKDEDSLPPYEILDKILEHIVEDELSAEEISKKGFKIDMVYEVEKLLYRAEFKRRQSAPGVKITSKPFGRDRRYPITNKLLEY